MTINDRIGAVLKELNMTQTEFAHSLGVSQEYISKIIHRGNPSNLFIGVLCRTYGINEEWLRNGTGKMRIAVTDREKFQQSIAKLKSTDNETIKKWVSALADIDTETLQTVTAFMEQIVLPQISKGE